MDTQPMPTPPKVPAEQPGTPGKGKSLPWAWIVAAVVLVAVVVYFLVT